MLQNFSFKRFLQLIQKQWEENSRLYLLSLTAIALVLGLIHFFWIAGTTSLFEEEFGFGLFWLGLFLCGSIFASQSFGVLGNKEKGTYWLMVPASRSEKFFNVLFYNVVVFPLFYILIFFIVHKIALTYIHYLVSAFPNEYRLTSMRRTKEYYSIIKTFSLIFIAIQSLYVLGSIYFNRFNYILTTLASSVLFAIFMYYTFKLGNAMNTSAYMGSMGHDHVTFYSSNGGKEFVYDTFIYKAYRFIGHYIWAPVFYTIAWFRLKEKQL